MYVTTKDAFFHVSITTKIPVVRFSAIRSFLKFDVRPMCTTVRDQTKLSLKKKTFQNDSDDSKCGFNFLLCADVTSCDTELFFIGSGSTNVGK